MNQMPPRVYVEKRTKTLKDETTKTYEYYVASWRVMRDGRSKAHNVYIGKVGEMTGAEALEKATRLKLGASPVIKPPDIVEALSKRIKALEEQIAALTGHDKPTYVTRHVPRYVTTVTNSLPNEPNVPVSITDVTKSERVPGVTLNKRGRWEVRARVGGKRKYIASFADRDEAIKAKAKAEGSRT